MTRPGSRATGALEFERTIIYNRNNYNKWYNRCHCTARPGPLATGAFVFERTIIYIIASIIVCQWHCPVRPGSRATGALVVMAAAAAFQLRLAPVSFRPCSCYLPLLLPFHRASRLSHFVRAGGNCRCCCCLGPHLLAARFPCPCLFVARPGSRATGAIEKAARTR